MIKQSAVLAAPLILTLSFGYYGLACAQMAIDEVQPTSGGGAAASGAFSLRGSIRPFSHEALPSSASFLLSPAALGKSSEPDRDGDGVPDSLDAFPDDPAASVDTDGDGFPDAWNPGFEQSDSTTGLRLDDFPSDPSRPPLFYDSFEG